MIKEHDQQANMKAKPKKLAYDDSDKEAPTGSRRLEDHSTTREKARRERSKSKRKRSGHQEASSDSEYEEGSDDACEDMNSPYKRPKSTPFTQRITRFKYHKRAKLPRNIGVYEGNKDLEDQIGEKWPLGQQKWSVLFGYVCPAWTEGPKRARNRGSPRDVRMNMWVYTPYPRKDTFTSLTKTPKEILAMESISFPELPPLIETPKKQNLNKFCDYHGDRGRKETARDLLKKEGSKPQRQHPVKNQKMQDSDDGFFRGNISSPRSNRSSSNFGKGRKKQDGANEVCNNEMLFAVQHHNRKDQNEKPQSSDLMSQLKEHGAERMQKKHSPSAMNFHTRDDEEKNWVSYGGRGILFHPYTKRVKKNSAATLQRMMEKVLADQRGRNMETYLEEIVIKNKSEMDLGRNPDTYFLCKPTAARNGNMLHPKKKVQALSHIARSLRTVFRKHKVKVVIDGPMEEILKFVEREGRLGKWATEIRTYDISYVQRKEAEGPVVLKFFGQGEQVDETPDANKGGIFGLSKGFQANSTPTTRASRLYLGREIIKEGSGVGIILISPEEKMYSYAIRLKFKASNHAMDCKALLAGLAASANQGMKDLHVFTDSIILIAQVEGNHTSVTIQERRSVDRAGNYKARIPQPESIDRYQNNTIDKEVPISKGSSLTTTERYKETYKNVSQDIRDQLNVEAKAVQIILTGIDNDIYSTVDACPNACEMWKDGESLKSYYSRFYKMMNELIRNQCGVTNHQVNVQFLLQLQPEWQRSQQATTRNRGKAIINSPTPIYDQEPSMVAEDDEMSKDKEIDKIIALISLSFKKIYKPTNNNLRTSSNTSRANQDNSPRINRGAGYDNQRLGNVAGDRETVGTMVVQKSRIQCYNCKEFGHVARECQKPKRVKDAAYHREKMLLCKQEEAGIQLTAEQADWRDDTDDESEDQELEAHYMYMAQLQEVSTDAADSGPIFDTEPVQKVSNNDHYNVFTIESEHPEQFKSIHNTYPIEQDEHNMIIDSLDMSYDREYIEQNDDDNDLTNERELLASLIEKLKCEIDDSKNRNKFLETSNKDLKAQLQDKGIAISGLKKLIEKLKEKSVDTNLNAKTLNVNSVCATCGKCVLNEKHDMCALKSRNDVHSRTKMPVAVHVRTREHKRTVKQSVDKPLRKTVDSESNQKPRNTLRKLYECVSKTCSGWYSKFTPPGYNWKPKSKIENVKPNVSMPLGNASRTANVLDPMTSRCSTVSNTPLSSNYFAARRDYPIHRRLWLVEIILFIVDSGCSKHMTGNLKLLINFVEKFLGTIKFGNDQIAPILGYGDLGNDLLTGSRGTYLYSITLQDTASPDPICLLAKAISSQAWLWHHRLSHLNFDTINLLSKNDIVVGLPKLKFVKDHLCSSCELGKPNESHFKQRLPQALKDGNNFYTWTYVVPCGSKDETPEVFIDFLRLVQRGLHAQVRTVRTDKGSEFLNQTLHVYFYAEGILHQTSVARTPEQNGVVERRNRYSTQSRAYRVFNKRTRVIVETIHINFDELPQMSSDHISSDPVPECQKTALEHVGSNSSAKSTADAHNQRQQQNTTPLNNHSTTDPTCQDPTHVPTVTSTENINQAEMIEENAQVENDEFINIFCTPVQDRGETSSRHVDSSNMHTFYQHHPFEHHWTKDHPLEQGCAQKEGVDFEESFVPVVRLEAVQLFIANSNHQSPYGIFINQAKYAQEILIKHGMTSCDSVGTPMATKYLDVDLSGTPVDQIKYHSMVRALMYLTASRQDIMHATCYCARYQAKPTEKHLTAVKRIFRYLKDTTHMGLWYPKDTNFELTAFLDSDHAGCLDSCKSTSGGIQFLGGDKLVSWSSKKQDCTSMSFAEAEYVSLSACCAQVLWMRTQLIDYGFHFDKIPMYCDSKAAISISCNPVQHSRTKHIDVGYHFIKEKG
nr:uncharacterized mitochondrial protein AtMg00810-like [Tanacetum cinerariifolium]